MTIEHKNTEYKIGDLTLVTGNAPPTVFSSPEKLAQRAEAEGRSVTHMWVKEAYEIDAADVGKKNGAREKYDNVKDLQSRLEAAMWIEVHAHNEKRGDRSASGGSWVGGEGSGIRKHGTIEVPQGVVPNAQEVAEQIAQNVIQSMGVDLSTGVEATTKTPVRTR